jgi:predicted negative regulator of RcsB-dependent stress response
MINRNALFLVIGALVVATVVFGYQVYQDGRDKTGVEINVGGQGISIEKK